MNSSGVHGLLLLFIITLATLQVPPAQARKKWNLHVVNKLRGPPQLLVHCKSKDDDLGNHYLSVGQEFSWGFEVNFFATTLFWCHVAPNSSYGLSFKTFWTFTNFFDLKCKSGDEKDCFWVAKDDGVYFTNFGNDPPEDEFMYKWEKS